MKVVLRILAGLAALVLLAVLVAFLLPRKYRVARETAIKASPEKVFAQVGDLRAWQKWSAWHERDPAMKLSFSEPSAGVGAWSAWESKTEGNGRMTFTTSDPGKQLRYKLEFPDYGMTSNGTMALAPTADGVRVVWSDEGDLGMNPMSRWFGLFLDRMIGPDFEKGLAKLKALTEAGAR
jgi:uncharacterized protein YndB with AHSA1/START domain